MVSVHVDSLLSSPLSLWGICSRAVNEWQSTTMVVQDDQKSNTSRSDCQQMISLFSSVIQSCSTLQPHGQQHARPPCPSPTLGVYSNSCPLSWWCHPTISSPSPAFSLSQHQGLFQWVSFFGIRWSKYLSFSFSISPSNEYSGLTFFRMDWLDLLAVQGTLKSLLQHHSSTYDGLELTGKCSRFL